MYAKDNLHLNDITPCNANILIMYVILCHSAPSGQWIIATSQAPFLQRGQICVLWLNCKYMFGTWTLGRIITAGLTHQSFTAHHCQAIKDLVNFKTAYKHLMRLACACTVMSTKSCVWQTWGSTVLSFHIALQGLTQQQSQWDTSCLCFQAKCAVSEGGNSLWLCRAWWL